MDWEGELAVGLYKADMARLRAENDRLRFALKTVLGDGTHGQKETWAERCRIGRAALES